jgi:hypothetical protein
VLPNAGIDIAPGVKRRVPEMTACATFVAVGSLTARLPEIVARGERSLMPVQLWQLTQACANTLRPSASATAPPSFGDAGAGGAIVAGSDEATAGMLRR